MQRKILIATLASMIYTSVVMAQQPNKEFDLKLDTNDLNLLGKGLGSLPFNEVAPLMSKIQRQVNEQNKPVETEKDKEKKN